MFFPTVGIDDPTHKSLVHILCLPSLFSPNSGGPDLLEIFDVREHRFDVNHRRAVEGFDGTDSQAVLTKPP